MDTKISTLKIALTNKIELQFEIKKDNDFVNNKLYCLKLLNIEIK